jgi:predicted RNA binding protein YcfA (HicA-like mRNA interferase family)
MLRNPSPPVCSDQNVLENGAVKIVRFTLWTLCVGLLESYIYKPCQTIRLSLLNQYAIHVYSPALICHGIMFFVSSILQTPDSKKEEFRKYLEKSGVIDALTKGSHICMNHPFLENKMFSHHRHIYIHLKYPYLSVQFWLVCTKNLSGRLMLLITSSG